MDHSGYYSGEDIDMKPQTRAALDNQLQALQEDILRMGVMVKQATAQSMQALVNRDIHLAQQVIDDDEKINDMRFNIEESGIRIVATQQPVTFDLRELMAGMYIANELERMGDHAEGIARIVIRMGDEPLLKPLIDLPRMSEACQEMLESALESYVDGNVPLAREVAARDDFIDDLYTQVFRELLTYMLEDPKTVTRALYLLFIAHNLERIGDRVTNLAERVVFIQLGDMREMNPEPPDADLG
jgi:phosphate transport system protein